jgi:putative NADH-flavin reductase
MGLMGQQYDIGAKQQAYEQARLNQIIQDYATEQQYPFIQLGTLSNMLRGLPMQASSTQMYQAQPSMFQQGIGFMGAAANMYNAYGGRAEGGHIKEMAGGGIASGVDPYKLPGMMKKLSDDQLKKKTNPQDTDPETLGIAQAEKQRRDKVRGMASGGIVAFKEGNKVDEVDNPFKEKDEAPKKAAPPVASRPKAAAPKPAVDTSPFQTEYKRIAAEPNKALEELKAQQTSFKTEADVGIEGQMERKQKLYDKYGIDPIAMIQNEKVEQQKALERAQGDAKKAEYLRWAQMFAQFGSTPGPILRAAVMSINNTIPDLIEDQDKARALQKEINKSINDLDRAALMEKKGRVDDAYKLDQEAKGNLAKLSLDISKLQVHEFENKRTSAAQMASAEMQKQASIQSAALRAAATGGGGEARADKERRLVEQAIDKAYKDQTEAKRKQLDRFKSMPTETQKKYQPQIEQIERELSTTRREIEARYKKDYPEAFKETAPAGSSKADTSGWGELRVKG